MLLAFCALIVGTLAAQDSSPSNFNRFTYNVGAGPGVGHGDVASFVGNSFNGVAGAGMNFTRIFGADVEYMYYDLDRKSVV